jgi:hypothetical protein
MTITLVYGGTTLTLDTEGEILDFGASQSCDVAVPDWVNQSPSIDTNIWSKSKEVIMYSVRLSDVGLGKLRTLQTTHTLIDYNDSVYGKSSKHVWINNADATWDGENNWTLPWKVVITLILVD